MSERIWGEESKVDERILDERKGTSYKKEDRKEKISIRKWEKVGVWTLNEEEERKQNRQG